nr:expansin-like B1 [Ipomoea batatas]
MGFSLKQGCTLLCILMVLPAAFCYTQTYPSKATYYTTPDGKGTPTGACGYGKYGRSINDGLVSAASSRLYRYGAGCGACYLVRCKDEALCKKEGVKVVITDNGEGPATDFILSHNAYAGLAKPYAAKDLFARGVIDVVYERVSCGHGKLKIKIVEQSNYHGYLAILPFNQGGANDILSIEVYEKASYKWIPMRRSYGTVFDLQNPPKGELKLRFLVSGQKWIESKKAIIPDYWKAGTTIDTDIQLP